MKTLSASLALLGGALVFSGGVESNTRPVAMGVSLRASATSAHAASANALAETMAPDIAWSPEDDNAVIEEYCVRCHSERRLRGNLSLEDFDAATPQVRGEVAEKMIVKLRAGMMPPPGASRPTGDTLRALVEAMERRMDDASTLNPDPGGRSFQRLNQAEYARSIFDLFGLEIDASAYLPLDTKSANFDNIADAQMLSPTLLDAYLNAAANVSRLAVGDPDASPSSWTYTNPGYTSQWERAEGAPYGTRGGLSVTHAFVADGEYEFRLAFEHTTTGGYFGSVTSGEEIEVSIDGRRVALLEMDRWMSVADPNGVNMRTEPIFVRAGPHRVTAAFLKRDEGPVDDLLSPHDWSLSDRQIGVRGYGITSLAHLKDLVIAGPSRVTGVSETPARTRIFTCRPTTPDEQAVCAREIIARLAPQAFRRSMTDGDEEALMRFYALGFRDGGFEIGVRTAIEAMLASPDFIFRMEEAPVGITVGERYAVSDDDLATRMSFFIWGLPPDDELRRLAASGDLSDSAELERQVRAMLADPRADALATRFAAQWLRLDDLDKVHPDRLLFPDFHQRLADDLRQETEAFFAGLVRDDASIFDLYTADYSYMNERVARHYGIDGVVGEDFRRVAYPDDSRRGILGHASILTLTSHAGRTSPVLRGKWVMEVLLGTPPPPPPPGVPTLEETADASDGRMLTTRERMEAHRANPTCNACHRFMDPIGLSLDNYDVTGQWRIRENGVPLDTRGELYDGTPITTPAELNAALVSRPIPLVRTFTQNLMAYALGRRLEYYDQPTVRAIVRGAEEDGYRMSSFVVGIVLSDAFQMQRAGAVADAAH
jgi:cytochrome c5